MLSFVIMQTSCMMQKGQDMKADIIKIDGARRTTVKHTVIIADKQTEQLIRIYERLMDKQKAIIDEHAELFARKNGRAQA